MSPARDAARFGRVITAMVTPFDEEGALDVPAAVELARWLAAHGSEGLVLSGSTGESSVLTDDEKVVLWRAVAEAVSIPVIAGTGSNDTAHSVHMTSLATECGVDGVLVVTPYYNRPSQAGIFEHFRAVAEAAGSLPAIVYDIPVRTGRRIATGTLLRLAREVPNVVALKDAAGDAPTTAHLAAQAPAGFEVYSGDDTMTLPLLAIGAVGVISVASHWVGPQFRAAVDAFLAGDLEVAIAGNAALLESFDFESSPEYPNPLPAKAAMRALGLRVGQCRLPMGPATPELDARAARVVAAVGPPAVTVAAL
ncbi:MAG TPA: 4-hydroxy-tetrahydrodipicolinate synthase, partial [Acidimicrobiales bacterium]|nr:4-hydroxy-tetrahydrodipicolinate synthase [Acidimicrobiales bacterium]